jgi:uncharacterized protein YidB (DUF937 family)
VEHDKYLGSLRATLDHVLGELAEAGTSTQVRTWFSDKYAQLVSKDDVLVIIEEDVGAEKSKALR